MEKLQHRISIDAPKEKVWETLWNKSTYEAWTAPFHSGSSIHTDDYKKGSKVIFGDGQGNGMVSRIAENIPYKFMSFEHLGEVTGGVEDTTSEKVKAWAGSHENYTLEENGRQTELVVEMDITPEFAAMFNDIWPKALGKVKEIAEA